ncbi:MAG: HEAT repeat domain-containing protein [Myxococcales bacterium]|nr:HEAT repeat domain-containing protein [Myxococcales bacterium]
MTVEELSATATEKAFDEGDPESRRRIVHGLGARAGAREAALTVLPKALGDGDWRVRKEAVQLALSLGSDPIVVPLLVGLLRAPSEQVALRNAAVEALIGLGSAAIEPVENALLDSGTLALDADSRKLALEVLAGLRASRSLPVVLPRLQDPDANVRAVAAEAVGLIGGEGAVPALRVLLASPDRYLRLIALEGLNRMRVEVEFAAVAPLVSDRILRAAALAALGRTGDAAAVPLLAQGVAEVSRHLSETALIGLADLVRAVPAARADAARALRALPPDLRSRVIGAAGSEEPSVRRAGLLALGLLGDGAALERMVDALAVEDSADDAEAALAEMLEPPVPLLVEAIRHGGGAARTSAQRAAVVRLLPRLAPAGDSGVMAALREALRDHDGEVSAAAAAAFAVALGGGAVPEPADVHALLRVASPRDPGVALEARAAAVALQSLRTLARIHPDVVRSHLSHVDVADDEAAVVSSLLAVAGDRSHVAWLSRAAGSASARTRRAAVEALGAIGGESAVSALALALADESSDVVLAAVRALGRVRDEAGAFAGAAPLRALVTAAAEVEIAVRAAAIRALGATHDPGAVDVLRPLLEGDSARAPLICAAIEALSELGSADVGELAASVLGHASPAVVHAAMDVLELLVDGEPAEGRRVAQWLAPTLAHGTHDVRRRAIEVLARIGGPARTALEARRSEEDDPALRELLERTLAENGP